MRARIIVLGISAEVPLTKLNMIEKGCLICFLSETNLDFQATKSMDKIVVDHLGKACTRENSQNG
jgi:hypothetical protein